MAKPLRSRCMLAVLTLMSLSSSIAESSSSASHASLADASAVRPLTNAEVSKVIHPTLSGMERRVVMSNIRHQLFRNDLLREVAPSAIDIAIIDETNGRV